MLLRACCLLRQSFGARAARNCSCLTCVSDNIGVGLAPEPACPQVRSGSSGRSKQLSIGAQRCSKPDTMPKMLREPAVPGTTFNAVLAALSLEARVQGEEQEYRYDRIPAIVLHSADT